MPLYISYTSVKVVNETRCRERRICICKVYSQDMKSYIVFFRNGSLCFFGNSLQSHRGFTMFPEVVFIHLLHFHSF